MNFQTLLTDNATLSDAAIGFYAIENQLDISKSIIPNWLKFLENSVLYDEMVADNNVFDGNIWAQKLRDDFSNVSGIEINSDMRAKINEVANSKISELDKLEFENIHDNTVRSNVKRLLFYLGLSNEISSTYSPSSYRNQLIQGLSEVFKIEDTKTELETKLLNNVVLSAQRYANNVEKESGIKMVIAELPPISSMVINKAIKCGSWSEAIQEIKDKRTAYHFREWAAEVAENLESGNNRALARLKKVNNFINGWGDDEMQGLQFKLKFGLGAIFNTVGLQISTPDLGITIPHPFPRKHIVFLNDAFQSLLAVDKNWGKIKQVKV